LTKLKGAALIGIAVMNIPITQQLLRHSLLYEFALGTSAAEAYRKLCVAFGEDVISRMTCYNWYDRFKEGSYETEDKPRSGRPSELSDETVKEVVEANPRATTREMASILRCDHSTVVRRLSALGKVQKLGTWIPHALTQANKERRVQTCTTLLSYSRRTNWLANVVTGDEKWVLYVNLKRRHQWFDK